MVDSIAWSSAVEPPLYYQALVRMKTGKMNQLSLWVLLLTLLADPARSLSQTRL